MSGKKQDPKSTKQAEDLSEDDLDQAVGGYTDAGRVTYVKGNGQRIADTAPTTNWSWGASNLGVKKR